MIQSNERLFHFKTYRSQEEIMEETNTFIPYLKQKILTLRIWNRK